MTTEDAEQRIKAVIDGGWQTMGLALGSALGLFTPMCQSDKWMTSAEIAIKTNCKERYVREWLYFMTSCGIVEMTEDPETFFLPHLFRDIVDSSLMKSSKYILGLAATFPQLTEAFKKHGPAGVDYKVAGTWLRFWEGDVDIGELFDKVHDQLPADVQQKLEKGIEFCDLGGGRGTLSLVLAKKYPNSHFTNCDNSEDALKDGQAKAKSLSLTNVTFCKYDVADLPPNWTEKFDLVTIFYVLHNVPYPVQTSKEMYRILKPGGCASLLEVLADSNPQKMAKDDCISAHSHHAFNLYNCLSASLAFPGSAGLGACPGEQKLVSILTKAQFSRINKFEVDGDKLHLLCLK